MNKKRMIVIGIIGILIGLALLAIFGSKLAKANDFLRIGTDWNFDSAYMNAWNNHADSAKIGIGVGAVVLLVFGCLTIGGCCMDKRPEKCTKMKERLEDLEDAKASGLITDEEYEKKRAEILADF